MSRRAREPREKEVARDRERKRIVEQEGDSSKENEIFLLRRERGVGKDSRPERAERKERVERPRRRELFERAVSRDPTRVRSRNDGSESSRRGERNDTSLATESTLNNTERRPSRSRGTERHARSRTRNSAPGEYLVTAATMKLGSLFTDDGADETNTNYTMDSNMPDITDPLLVTALIKQSTIDSEGFTVLLPEKYLDQKQRLSQIVSYFESLQNKLLLEFQVKEASEALLNSGNTESQAEEIQRQLLKNKVKMDNIVKQLFLVVGDLLQAERGILKHIGGSLRLKVQELAQSFSDAPTLRVNRADQDIKRKLASSEGRIKELEGQLKMKRSGSENGSSLEVNKLKLDLAKTRAELSETKEEVEDLRILNGKLQAKSKEYDEVTQEKDRQISNLKAELEEATNALEMGNNENTRPSGRSSPRRIARAAARNNTSSVESNDLKQKLESDTKSVSALQEVVDEQAEKLKELRNQRDKDFADSRAELETTKSLLKKEISALRELHAVEISEMDSQYQKDFASYKEKIEKEKLDIMNKEDSSLENQKKLWEKEANVAFDQKLSALKKQHESDLEELKAETDLEKAQFKVNFQKEQLESRFRLENAEQALVDAKKQFFSEREKLEEIIDEYHFKVEDAEGALARETESLTTKKNQLQASNDELQEKVDTIQNALAESNKKLEFRSRDLEEMQSVCELQIKQISLDFEAKCAILEKTIDGIKSERNELEQIVAGSQGKEYALQQELQMLLSEISNIRETSKLDVVRAQEASFEASDQLDRVQRLLRDVTGDVDRYKKLADERDQEVLNLKRQLRVKEKELTDGAVSGVSDDSNIRRIISQKDKELDVVRGELRAAKAEASKLTRKVEVKDRETQDIKNRLLRSARVSNKDEQLEEITRLQVMLLELKTTRVDLLEKLDDSEHQVELLKNEMKLYKPIPNEK